VPALFPWQRAALDRAEVPVAACSRALLLSSRALSRAMLDCWFRMRARPIKQSVRPRPAGMASQSPCPVAACGATSAADSSISRMRERRRRGGMAAVIAAAPVRKIVVWTVWGSWRVSRRAAGAEAQTPSPLGWLAGIASSVSTLANHSLGVVALACP